MTPHRFRCPPRAFALLILLSVLLFAPSLPAQTADQESAESAEPSIRILFLGDILLEASWQSRPPPPASLFDNVREILHGADLVIGNLEEPLTNHPTRTPHKNAKAVEEGRDFVFRATSPDAARALRDAGIDVATLANNHTMDYTEQGLLDTLASLAEVGIAAAGGGRNLREADQVRVVTIKGVRIGVVSLSDVVPRYYWATGKRPGISPAKYIRRVGEVVTRARPRADVLLVAFHWGPMFVFEPTERQQRWARESVKAGADIVLGAHPHVLQGIGCVESVPVVYSAGNFVFPTSNSEARRSAIFELQLTGQEVAAVRILPVQLDDEGRPAPATGDAAAGILGMMKELSTDLGAVVEGDVTRCAQGAN